MLTAPYTHLPRFITKFRDLMFHIAWRPASILSGDFPVPFLTLCSADSLAARGAPQQSLGCFRQLPVVSPPLWTTSGTLEDFPKKRLMLGVAGRLLTNCSVRAVQVGGTLWFRRARLCSSSGKTKMVSSTAILLGAISLVAGAAAQSTAPQYGQCGGIGWTGATTCPDGWSCTVSNEYYSQCLPGASTPTSTVATSSGGSSPTSTTGSSPSATVTLIPGNSFIRAVEDPNFHQYLRSEVANTASDAVLGDPSTAAQFQITDGQLIQLLPDGSSLYAAVESRANATVMKLKMSWQDTPASGDAAGTFMWSGDTVEWSIASISRPQLNAWLVCPDEDGNKDVYINLGAYDYETPAGCADETIHAYTGPYATA
ncbi:hypothetical protein GSI_09275 [Ganoderma sinense ZZ0214-1]|uniref:CBM1 domain-containing protein n=1 Tax=Ganoderma sinense ZZ0214-1 TaxID=1077348 RepID=A0A2G8S625_9APHY|nr:hypothetical protein GSI_09275 [Ganoderma sinense ZZ0214-1]